MYYTQQLLLACRLQFELHLDPSLPKLGGFIRHQAYEPLQILLNARTPALRFQIDEVLRRAGGESMD